MGLVERRRGFNIGEPLHRVVLTEIVDGVSRARQRCRTPRSRAAPPLSELDQLGVGDAGRGVPTFSRSVAGQRAQPPVKQPILTRSAR